jgi:predicted NAD-dependent protein-ADP-ribosyltransferase YbiA (DUF1768 family)
LFKDEEIAAEILKAKKPGQCKSLGRKVENFDDEIWINNRTRIVSEGNYLKVKSIHYLKSMKFYVFSLHKMKI